MEKLTFTNKIPYKKILKNIEDSLFKNHLENEINEINEKIDIMKNKIAELILNPESYMDNFLRGNGLGTPKNGYISPEARQKAKKKKKRKKKK